MRCSVHSFSLPRLFSHPPSLPLLSLLSSPSHLSFPALPCLPSPSSSPLLPPLPLSSLLIPFVPLLFPPPSFPLSSPSLSSYLSSLHPFSFPPLLPCSRSSSSTFLHWAASLQVKTSSSSSVRPRSMMPSSSLMSVRPSLNLGNEGAMMSTCC